MTIEQELQLSYYRQVAEIDAAHRFFLVQDIRDQQFYVKKLLKVYNVEIYRYLQAHPIANVPRIYLLVEDEQGLTIIEEYIHGQSLEQRLQQDGILSQSETLSITIQLCTILQAFHNCSTAIINRDIKPSNIKITPDGVVKLVDLNVAKWEKPHANRDTVLLGTEGYAAPEQYGFGASNEQTDIYAVGVLMNVMLTGKLPSQQLATGKLMRIICICVTLTPNERYKSMAELLKTLKSLSRWQRYLPPGYRSPRPVRWLFATILYITFIPGSLTMFYNKEHVWGSLCSGLLFSLTLFAIILFNGNYLNVQDTFYFTRSRNRLVRWIGIILIDFMLLFAWGHLDEYVMVLFR